MRFTPKYNVSYHGEFHHAGKPFDIDGKDAAEMSRHGTVEAEAQPGEDTAPRRVKAKKDEE